MKKYFTPSIVTILLTVLFCPAPGAYAEPFDMDLQMIAMETHTIICCDSKTLNAKKLSCCRKSTSKNTIIPATQNKTDASIYYNDKHQDKKTSKENVRQNNRPKIQTVVRLE